jgi:hypothetical protein
LAPGYETRISLSRKFIYKQPAPYSDCISQLTAKSNRLEKGFYNFITKYNFSYQQVYCTNFYKQNNVIEKCGCQSFWFREINETVPMCSYFNECFFNESTTFDFDGCPPECNSIIFDLSTSLIEYPSIGYLKSFKNSSFIKSKFSNRVNGTIITDEEVKGSMVAFALYYKDFTYSSLDEIPLLSALSSISNIGGTLGLFLGMSLLSFIEIIEVIIEFMAFHCQK